MTAPSRSRLANGVGALSLAAGAVAFGAVPASPVAAVPTPASAQTVLINEVYGGGGGAGSTFTHDFVELYNTSASAIDLSGWGVQYASAAGTSWQRTALTGSIPPGGYFLIQLATGGGGTTPLPVPDAAGGTNISGSAGKVALTDATVSAPLACGTTCTTAPGVMDFVGYGTTASQFLGTGPTPAPGTTTSVTRSASSANTQDNAADFGTQTPSPKAPSIDPPPVVDAGVLTIAQIQGAGFESPFAGQRATTTGVVTAVYPTGGLGGYVIQTPGTGGQTDLAGRTTSDGLFVSSPSTVGARTIGELVTVSGVISESFGLTQITVTAGDAAPAAGTAVAPLPIATAWPASTTARESIESMLYRPVGPFTVSDTFSTNQYGEVGLASGTSPLRQPTDIADFGSPGAAAVAADNAARQVTLDDGSTIDFLNAANTGLTPPYLSATEPVRVGASPIFATDFVVDYRNGLWKLQPPTTVTNTTPTTSRTTFTNTRTPAPDAAKLGAGPLQVASFNVLNYFTTLGVEDASCTAFTDRTGAGVTVRGGCDQRGAWDAAAFGRQQVKIVNAINALDASVVGLMEIENSARLGETADEAVASLVAALNAAAGSTRWAFVPSSTELPEPAGMDVISNAIIYQPAEVTPLGASRALGDQGDAGEPFSNAREPVGQAFAPVGGGDPFFVAVNHFKSKSATGATGPEVDSGQGAYNASRVAQAAALRDWVPTVLASYTTTPVQSVFLIGDFNSYTQEDPLQVLYAAGYADSNALGADFEYSYSFDGLSGSLDHVLVNASAAARLTGSDIWNINSPESLALEYSRYNYHGTIFYDETPFRSSDHDPVIVAFERSAADYNPVTPVRIFDTRPGQSPSALRTVPKAKVSGDPPLSVQVTDLAGAVPSVGVGAVSLNVTVTGATVPGFVTVYSCGTRQEISSVNFEPGQTIANAVIAPVSAAGTVCFFSNTPVDVVVDLNGWFPSGQAFNSVGPARAFDTRAGLSPNALRTVPKLQVAAGGNIAVRMTDLPGLVPTDGVGAVSMNVTVTGSDAPGFVTVYPCGPRGQVSSVNFAAGQTIANGVISRVSSTGQVCFYSNTAVDLVVDVNGWFPVGAGFTGVDPVRLFDTRPGESTNALRDVPKAKVGGSTVLEVRPIGLSGVVPTEGISSVSMNVTVTGAEVDGFVTVYPCGTLPTTSSVNFVAGQTIANAVITPLSADGTVCWFSNTPVHVVVDVNGYFAAPPS